MKKQILKSALIAVAGVGLMAGWAMALPFNDRPITLGTSTEPSLQTILSNDATNGRLTSGSIDVYNDQSSAAIWNPTDGGSNAYAITGFAGWASNLGIYSYATGQEVTFAFTATTQRATIDFIGANLLVSDANGTDIGYNNFGQTFGFYIEVNDPNQQLPVKYYTEDDKNGGTAMALAYNLLNGTAVKLGSGSIFTSAGNDDWILAWEDGGGDNDFNDKVYLIEDQIGRASCRGRV